ncbi:MAG: OmpP1/FadL family transporter, partial [Gammaproteobacteria bacterium]
MIKNTPLPAGTRAPTVRFGAHLTVLFGLFAMMPTVSAINGYFMPGYGPKALAVAGTGVAMPQDQLASAINPAGLALVAPGFNASAKLLHPQRAGSVDCTGIGLCDQAVADRSKREFFVVPALGYSRRWGERTTLGIAMYANGGLNTSYGRAFYDEAARRIAGQRPGDPGFPTRGKIGVDFAQFITALSAAFRASERWTLGIAPLIIIQKFSARGLEGFASLSADPTSLDGRDSDYELGAGVRVGAIYQLRPDVRLGAQYSSPLFVHRYTKYNGLFVDGKLDSPAHYTVGVSWEATPKLTLGFDFQRILFGDVDTIGNPGPTAAELMGVIEPARRLGGAEGSGFGWNNVSVYKVGAIYAYNDKIILRAGWNHNSGVVPG